MGFVNSLIEWTKATFLPYGESGLFILAFMESSFFPVPADILLILLSLVSPEKALLYAAVCTLGSVLGGIFGYFIGIKGGLPLLKRFVKESKIKTVHSFFNRYEAWAIFIAGFTPLPYKFFTISAGVFYINFKKFIIASITSRGLRFFIEGTLLMIYGEWIADFLKTYFNIITILIVAVIIAGYFLINPIKKRIEKREKEKAAENKEKAF